MIRRFLKGRRFDSTGHPGPTPPLLILLIYRSQAPASPAAQQASRASGSGVLSST